MHTSRNQRYITRSQSPVPNPSTRTNPNTSTSTQVIGTNSGSFHPQEYFTSSTNLPPVPTDPSGIYSTLVTDRDLTLSKKKYVKVIGTSELEIEPDRINFVIQIKSIKPDIRDARSSIKKREEYILNVLKKHYIPESSYTIAEFVEKIQRPCLNEDELGNLILGEQMKKNEAEASNTKVPMQQFDSFKLTKEINVNTDNLMKYLQISSICTEKLDNQVLISQPIIKFSPVLLQTSSQMALRQAMVSSQAKARELVGNYKHHENTSGGVTHLSLGSLIYSSEDSLMVQEMGEYEATSSHFETFKWKRFNKRINCQITSAFEIIHTKPKKYI